jgi:hypothetical protein
MSYVLSAAHKFDFRLVIHETHNKWRTLEASCSDVFMFLTGSVCSPPTAVTSIRDYTHAVQVNCNFLRDSSY